MGSFTDNKEVRALIDQNHGYIIVLTSNYNWYSDEDLQRFGFGLQINGQNFDDLEQFTEEAAEEPNVMRINSSHNTGG